MLPANLGYNINIHNSVLLQVVLHRHESWSLTLKEENILFENRVLKIFEPKQTMRYTDLENCTKKRYVTRRIINCTLHQMPFV
jgi:hypothetical protein